MPEVSGDAGRPRVVDGDEVRRLELEQIAVRRHDAFGCDCLGETSESVQRNLIGLALSGGGVRSGAFSLGLLQALHRLGVLPFIDYLSTVSGGGYAGAFLSSLALKRTRSSQNSTNGSAGGAAIRAAGDLFPIASGADPRAPRRMLRFIHGGNYLRHWWKFFNRYLIGLALLLTVTISGLLAVASLTAYAFRSLDHVEARDWLTALGFRDDLTQAFFPSFVLCSLWLACWTLSYFKYGGRATGAAARYLFYALVLVTGVAVAVLLVTGDISLTSFERSWGKEPDAQAVGSVASTVWIAVLTAIVVGLLPYLSPRRLIQSGASPRNSIEKYAFWIASRALVFGVPFLVIAFFARENFSHWNNLRDDRLALTDLEGNAEAWPPLFQRIYDEAQQASDAQDETTRTPGTYLWHGRNGAGELLEERLARLQQAHADMLESELGVGQLRSLQQPARADRSLTDADHDLSFWSRWAYLAILPGQALLGDGELSNPLWSIVQARREDRRLRREILYIVNCRLLDPSFHEFFNVERLKTLYPGRPKARWEELQQRKSEAVQLSGTLTEMRSKAADLCSACLAPLKKAVADRSAADQRRSAAIHESPESEHPQFPTDEAEDLLALSSHGPPSADRPQLSVAEEATRDEALRRALLQQERSQRAILAVNRKLLAAHYGDALRPRSRVTSYVTLDKDQQARMTWFAWSLAVFLLAGLIVDLNATSLHGFYASQVSRMWTEEAPGLGRDIPLAQLETVEVGRPYHLISGSMHLVGRREAESKERRCDHFLFSKLFCGSDRIGYARTEDWMGGQYRLADAVAVSGGAVSPTQIPNPLVAVLLILANIRLGQWVANPAYLCRTRWGQALWFGWPMTPLRFLLRLGQKAEERPFVFVADGGHHENLGIEPLLKRRCRLIIASDAGMDKDYRFADFMRLLRWARIMHGIEFVTPGAEEKLISLDQLVPHESTRRSRNHYVVAKIKYPDDGLPGPPDRCGYLVYLKSSLRGDEPPDLLGYRDRNPEFPHDSTADQFFDPERFESYRQLGEKIGLALCNHLREPPLGAPTDVDALIAGFVGTSEFPEVVEPQRLPPPPDERPGEAGGSAEAAARNEADRGMDDQSLAILTNPSADAQDRVLAAEHLGARGTVTREVVEALLSAAAEADEQLAKAALHALPELGPATVPFLRDGLGEPGAHRQGLALQALQEVFRRQPPGTLTTPDRALAERLMVMAVAEGDAGLRAASVCALGELARWLAPEAAARLERPILRIVKLAAARDRSSTVQRAAREVRRALQERNGRE